KRVGTKFPAQDIGDSCEQGLALLTAGQIVETRGVGRVKSKTDVAMRHGKALHGIGAGPRLSALASQEFAPRRGCSKKIANLDPGSLWLPEWSNCAFSALIDADRISLRRFPYARKNIEECDRTDGGQGLAAKSKRRDLGKIAKRQFGCGVALDSKLKI